MSDKHTRTMGCTLQAAGYSVCPVAWSLKRRRFLVVLFGLAWFLLAPSVFAETEGERRFFHDCPHRPATHVHDDRNPWDPHSLVYTTLSVSELEVLRVADWLIDLPMPGEPLHPLQRATRSIRAGFHRLPRWTVIRRTGELVDAFQLPELSLGDASAARSAATGGSAGPGSGMILRINKLVDWMQHVVGDVNGLTGRLIGRPRGLITWALPGRMVDGGQWALQKTFNAIGIVVERTIDGGLSGSERLGDGVLNLGWERPHQQQTVFLRMSARAFRVHELWLLEHRSDLVIGSAATVASATHAMLAHRKAAVTPAEWPALERFLSAEEPIIVMTTRRVIARAPDPLKAYVVPAAWVLDAGEYGGRLQATGCKLQSQLHAASPKPQDLAKTLQSKRAAVLLNVSWAHSFRQSSGEPAA